MMWVVSANTQLSFFLSFFFWSLCHALRFYRHQWTDFDDLHVMWRASAQRSAFWGSQ